MDITPKIDKVLLLSFWFVEYCVKLANGLSKNLQVKLMIPKEIADDSVTVHLSPEVELELFEKVKRKNPANLIHSFAIVKAIRDFRPDLVHIQCNGHAWFCFLLPFIHSRNRLVFTVHDPVAHPGEETFVRNMANRYIRRIGDHFIVHGRALKDQMIQEHGMKQSDIDIIPIGSYNLKEKDGVFSQNSNENRVLFFGRIQDYKGIEYLIDSEPLISKEVNDFKIIIAGTGKSFQPYKERIKNKDRFIILNHHIPGDELASLFLSSSFVVLPYTQASQSGIIPLTYSYRLPVITTTVGSLPEVVDNGVTGILVPPGDTEKLAAAIVRLLQDKDLARRMGENGFQKQKRDLSWDLIAQKTLQTYQRCLAKRS